MKQLKVIILFFIIGCFLFRSPIQAVTIAPAPSITPSSENNLNSEIENRVKERLQNITQSSAKKGFWGNLKEISKETLIIESNNGDRKIIINEKTKYVGVNKKEIKFEDLKTGDFIIALSILNENGDFEGRRITALKKAPTASLKRTAIFGEISDISKEEKIISVKREKKNTVEEVKINDKTVITKKVDEKIKKVTFDSLVIGDRVVAVLFKEIENNGYTAKILHVIPGKAEGQ